MGSGTSDYYSGTAGSGNTPTPPGSGNLNLASNVPSGVREIYESYGLQVDWEKETRTIKLRMKGAKEPFATLKEGQDFYIDSNNKAQFLNGSSAIPYNTYIVRADGTKNNAVIIAGKTVPLKGGELKPGDTVYTKDGSWYIDANGKSQKVGAPGNTSQAGNSLASLAKQILNSKQITLMSSHVSGSRDVNTALKNIQDTSNGLQAGISNYGNAPGGSVDIDARVLSGILAISDAYGDIRITAIAGSSHSTTSKHYSGLAVDIDLVGGTKINKNNFTKEWYDTFESYVKKTLGASVVLHPYNDSSHTGSIHIQW